MVHQRIDFLFFTFSFIRNSPFAFFSSSVVLSGKCIEENSAGFSSEFVISCVVVNLLSKFEELV